MTRGYVFSGRKKGPKRDPKGTRNRPERDPEPARKEPSMDPEGALNRLAVLALFGCQRAGLYRYWRCCARRSSGAHQIVKSGVFRRKSWKDFSDLLGRGLRARR